MRNFISRFKNNTSGSIPILVGGIMVILVVAGGGAVDMWNAHNERERLQNSLDSAALYAAKISTTDKVKIEAAINDYFTGVAGLHKNVSNLKIEYDVEVRDGVNHVKAWASGKAENVFLRFAGMNKTDIKVFAEVARGGSPVEIALVLDVTGSMASFMPDLREAAESLVDIVFDAGGDDSERVSLALVPYSGTVNIGTKNVKAGWMDTKGDSKHHGKMLEGRYMGRRTTAECVIPPSGGGGGGGGGGPWHDPKTGGSGSDSNAGDFIPHDDGTPRAQRILSELFGMSSAHAGPKPADYELQVKWGDDCNLWNPDHINHFTLFDLIKNEKWGGCVESRPEPYDITDEEPRFSNPDTQFVPWFWIDNGDVIAGWQKPQSNDYVEDTPYSKTDFEYNYGGYTYKTGSWERTFIITKYNDATIKKDNKAPDTLGPNKSCPDEIVPLTNKRGPLKSAVKKLEHWEGSGTNSTIGLAWGWRVLSPNEPFSQGVKYGEKKKIIVLMTDGKNQLVLDEADQSLLSHNGSYGYFKEYRTGAKDFNEYADHINKRFAKLCTNIKASGSAKDEDVLIFTITFGVTDSKIQKLYEDCASRPPFAYNADTAAELKDAFETIGAMITRLHLTY